MDVRQSLWDFFELGNIAHETRNLLAEGIRRGSEPLPAEQQTRLSVTLSHLSDVREGCVIGELATPGVDHDRARPQSRDAFAGQEVSRRVDEADVEGDDVGDRNEVVEPW